MWNILWLIISKPLSKLLSFSVHSWNFIGTQHKGWDHRMAFWKRGSIRLRRGTSLLPGEKTAWLNVMIWRKGFSRTKKLNSLFPIPSTSSAAIRRRDSVKFTSTLFFSNIFIIMSCVRPGFSFSACKRKCFHVISILKLNFNRSELFTHKDRKLCGHHVQLCSA